MQRITRRGWILALCVLGLTVCASPNSRGRTPVGDTNVIDREEIENSRSAANAYDLISSIRPLWLQTRGLANLRQAAGEEDIVVYMDNARLGQRQTLRRVPLGSIQYMQFFSAPQATQRWGGGHLHGAILISTLQR